MPITPYTPARLREMAEQADRQYQALSLLHPPGTFNRERNDAYDLRERALACAQWMEDHGHAELVHVGPFSAVQLKKGQEVYVKAGTVIGGTRVAKRRYKVRLTDFWGGYVDTHHHFKEAERFGQARVEWAGSGGCWCRVDANDVEPVETAGAPA